MCHGHALLVATTEDMPKSGLAPNEMYNCWQNRTWTNKSIANHLSADKITLGTTATCLL